MLSAEQSYQQAMIKLARAQSNRCAETAALFQAVDGGTVRMCPRVDTGQKSASGKYCGVSPVQPNLIHGTERGTERNLRADDQVEDRYFFVKIDLGIMQCTPLRISTT